MASKIPLNTVCERKITTLSPQYHGPIEYVDISSVDNIEKRIVSSQIFDAKDAPNRAKQLIKRGDILVSTVRPNLNAVAIVDRESEHLFVASTGYCVLRCNSKTDNHYVFHFCQSPYFIDDMVSQATGASYPAVSSTIVKNSLIPLPSLGEQKHIAAVLDKVSDLIALRKQQLAKLDELVKARFVEMFGDPETNPNNYPVLSWQAVFLTTTGKLDSNAMVEGGKYPFFTCAKEHFWIDQYAFDCEALLLAGNNAAGIYDVKYYNGKFNAYQRTYVLQLLDKSWSYSLFKRQLEDKLAYLQSQSKGSNTRYLTLGILNGLHFILPPIEQQKQFAAFVNQVDKSKLTVQQGLNKLELLKKALMQQYFG